MIPFSGVTQKILLHVPATIYEPAEEPDLRITNPLAWIKKAAFSDITSSMLRETLSILQSLADNNKPCFDELIYGCLFTYLNVSQSLLWGQLPPLEIVYRISLKPFSVIYEVLFQTLPDPRFSTVCWWLLSSVLEMREINMQSIFYNEISGLYIICCELIWWIS